MLQLPVLLARVYWRLLNPLVTANYVGDKLYGALFKGTREFSAKSYHKHLNL
jgi:hypothetical protein